ncbi:MAG TPA: beta-galactosidase [Humibacter sp.]|nr:beta-galactosidase [Humibacter sp.]
MNPTRAYEPSSVLFGAAYYAEYQVTERTEEDLDLMKAAGFTVIRVGESVWSTWEPRDGEFDLEWLLPVLDGAHRRGIAVILGTPTYAVPPWLQQAHPEIAAERAAGRPVPWGSRQEVDYSHPAFRYYAERIVRAVVGRYAGHPAVIGFQVDNEPGLELFHNHAVFTRFVRDLKRRYGDVETLNRQWGLTYWSHRIADWSELWRPEGNSLPQYDLEWRRFQARLTTEFIAWQADIVREYARPGQFVTTCINYPRRAHDDLSLTAALDVTAGNPYYSMQDHLDASAELRAETDWTTSGVAAFFRQADRLFSSKQARFLVTETNAQSIGGSDTNLPPWPGQLRMAALALVSRGAAMIEYWHWHTIPYGTETYWGGVIPHSLQPGRVYDEIAEIGSTFRRLGTALDGFEPDADVALLWSNDSRWAFEFFPPLNVDGEADPGSYQRIFDAFHRGAIDGGAQARILHVEQAAALGAEELARRYPLLIAPALYAADDVALDLIRDYAAAGGHLVLGVRTGYADHLARARVAIAPDRLSDAAGVHYEESSNIAAPIRVIGIGSLTLPPDTTAEHWIDGLIADDAETIAGYEHPRFGAFPAVTSRRHGVGRITTVGTVPSPRLAAAIVRWAVPAVIADELVSGNALPVTISSGTVPDGTRTWFLFNWSWHDQELVLRSGGVDAADGTTYPAGATLRLAAWSSVVFMQETVGRPDTPRTPITTTTQREDQR